ncbi:phospholipase D family protein [Actibacterium sp. XHP0104]|uniref:phospholipase D family protein n=1 Tax=Actibacterium sp. XHP0104 TaxID=2984335 RepID=UPI0021E85F94|nr:phospholipase D family protein [Actibacterium sp. XHP0104]MCV2881889.1 phospholipase D family protein [Actibacterium sp. XHP0104]
MSSSKRSNVTFQNVLHTKDFTRRFVSSLSEEISLLMICSPYFGKLPEPFKDVEEFCRFANRRGVEKIQIVTGPPGGHTSLPIDTARALSALGVEIYIRSKPYLHAKMYHFEYAKGYFRSFVGSANFTIGGMANNHELVTEMEGVGDATPCHREIARLRDNGGAISYQSWLQRGQPAGEGEEN